MELSHDSAQVKALSSSAVTEYRVTVTDKRRAYYVFQKPFVCRLQSQRQAMQIVGAYRRRRLICQRGYCWCQTA